MLSSNFQPKSIKSFSIEHHDAENLRAYRNGINRTAAHAVYYIVSLLIVYDEPEIAYLASTVSSIAGYDGSRRRSTECGTPGRSSSGIAGHDYGSAACLAHGVAKRTSRDGSGERGGSDEDRCTHGVD